MRCVAHETTPVRGEARVMRESGQPRGPDAALAPYTQEPWSFFRLHEKGGR